MRVPASHPFIQEGELVWWEKLAQQLNSHHLLTPVRSPTNRERLIRVFLISDTQMTGMPCIPSLSTCPPLSPSSMRYHFLAAAGCLLVSSVLARAEDPILYGRDIRPLLSDRCFTCHGPDRRGQENELRLDSQEEAIKGAVAVGSPEKSELISRISTDDPELKMPPPASGKKPLTAEEAELLRRWIQDGANYSEHWSFTPVTRPPLPEVKQADWPAGAVDRYTLAAMERDGFQHTDRADRRTLIRRLYFDLLGLPPTPEEVAAFVADDSPTAFAQLVDRLLEDRRFGERMAMYWLDLVRYADTAGYHSDNERSVDAFRDYVIDAFNENKPFDQFTVEQLAGDLLPDATLTQKVASGYNRLLQTTEEGGAQAKEYTAIYQADRVRNVSEVWMAVTMGCCQCHDHKYDPFTMRDFYSLGAFFADVSEIPVGRQRPNLRLPTPEQANELAMVAEQLDAARKTPVDPQTLIDWAHEQRTTLVNSRDAWQITKPIAAASSGGQQLAVQDDGSLLTSGPVPDSDTYTITLPLEGPAKTGLRLEALTHDSFPRKSLSRANGNFVLSKVEVVLLQSDGTSMPVSIASAQADYEQPGWAIAGVLDDDPNSGWAGNGHVDSVSRTAVFKFAEPIAVSEGAKLQVLLKHESQHAKHSIGHPRLALTSQAEPAIMNSPQFPAELTQILQKDEPTWTDSDRVELLKQYRNLAAALEPVRAEIKQLEERSKAVEGSVRTMLVAESVAPREVRVLARGNWLDDSGEIVQPQVPARLGTLSNGDQRLTRLDLAKWLVRRDHPLTARVFVNRLWRIMFGQALARSLEDVGHQGEWPTHPELLDWLAVEFMESGWDVKHMLRLMANSNTYQQSSIVSLETRVKDPFNRHFARQTRYRRDAEMIRDNALAVSGLLVAEMGGHSVKPYQPPGYWQHLNFPQREWEADHNSNQYRRGLYTFWCRSFLHPSLLAFDAPSREECVAQRPRSNTPLQALVLLNDPTYVEAARVLGEHIALQDGSDNDRISFAFQCVLQRDPSSEEVTAVAKLLAEERKQLDSQPQLADEFLKNGDAKLASATARGATEWGTVARVLLNLHEAIVRE